MDPRAHWESVYRTKRSDEVSWYQREPAASLRLIRATAPDRTASIIDVGAGASRLVDALVAEGYRHLTVLDVSATALAETRDRLGAEGSRVTWIEGDVVTTTLPDAAYDVWHDRAVFHFLTEAADRQAYVAQVTRALRPGGHLIVATFAEDGPTRCSGLPVARYSVDGLRAEFAAFKLVDSLREVHVTPAGVAQAFNYAAFQRD